MDTTLSALLAAAGTIGLVHTLAGPDHYVPFIAMSRTGRWSLAKTVVVTVACGAGHVLSSVMLGVVAFAVASVTFEQVGWLESARGEMAGWLLLGVGVAYLLWGVRQAMRHRPHTHWHAHRDGTVHTHPHTHVGDHAHVHADDIDDMEATSLTPWVLFTIFVFGPCEPLIPLLMLPAAELSWWSVAAVTAVFAVSTIGTMTIVVVVASLGLARLRVPRLARYAHATAGAALTTCGLAILVGL